MHAVRSLLLCPVFWEQALGDENTLYYFPIINFLRFSCVHVVLKFSQRPTQSTQE